MREDQWNNAAHLDGYRMGLGVAAAAAEAMAAGYTSAGMPATAPEVAALLNLAKFLREMSETA
jgi:hypothetical protein